MSAVEQMLDVRTVAQRLLVSQRKIWRLIARHEFPFPVKVGASSRWFESDVVAYQQKLRGSR